MVTQPQSGFTRVRFVRPCSLERQAIAVEAFVCNISEKGAYVAVDPIPDVGERVQLSFPVPGSDAPVAAEAVVTWRNSSHDPKVSNLPSGCGLSFLALDPAALARIRELVEASVAAEGRGGE